MTWKTKPKAENPWAKKSRKTKAKTLENLGQLYGTPAVADGVDGTDETTSAADHPKTKVKPQNNTPLEKDEQAIVVVYCDKQGYPFFAIPNASRRTMWEAVQAKKAGMRPGIPDICFPVPMQGYGGLYIEMKRQESGIVSPVQKYWIALLRENNYKVEVAMGAEAAIALISAYFKGWVGLSDDVKSMLQAIVESKRQRPRT